MNWLKIFKVFLPAVLGGMNWLKIFKVFLPAVLGGLIVFLLLLPRTRQQPPVIVERPVEVYQRGRVDTVYIRDHRAEKEIKYWKGRALAGTPPVVVGRVDTLTQIFTRTIPATLMVTSTPPGQVKVWAIQDTTTLVVWKGNIRTSAFTLTTSPAGFLLTSRAFLVSPTIRMDISSPLDTFSPIPGVWGGVEFHSLHWRVELLAGISNNLKPGGKVAVVWKLTNW